MPASNFLSHPVWTKTDGDVRRFGFLVEPKHDNTQQRSYGGIMIMTLCEARCEMVKSTRSLVFMRAICTMGDRVVAACSGVCKVQN